MATNEQRWDRGDIPADMSFGPWLVERILAMPSFLAEAPRGVIVRTDEVELVPLDPVWAGETTLDDYVSGLTAARSVAGGPVEAVGVAGRFGLRPRDRKADPVGVLTVFLEWEDCRWWHWQALLGPDGHTVDPRSAAILSAERGDPLPGGLGRWWTRGRRAEVMRRVRDGRR